ncbi:hypothetical protein LOD99_5261 [Oopsacas minuta]|uniref:HAT C-terminal dimerisation domain-containing protein n=1 Tax=Oopsacas minuta TaxID=111878 RepID=A0AAV7JSE3_9METZ|nr:hypothetical protein LOD99_5261 [Oopsacas minuta]
MKKALSLANKEMQSRKDIVYLLIDVVITLAQLNLPFHGHNEGEVSTSKGVFKGIVELISRYYPPLMIHLQKGQANPKVRYVNINGEIIESLLDLIDVANCTAVRLVTTIVDVFSKHGLLIVSLCGQGYDGCATMAVTFTDILKLCDIISKYLQNEDLDISSASLHIKSLISTLQGYTTEAYFDQLYLQAEKIAENIGVTYSEPRHRKVPTRLDDSEHHVPIVLTRKDRMKEQFFNDVIELIKEVLQSRFSHETMPLLKSIECLNCPKAENIQDLRVLSSYYIGDFDAYLIEYEYKLLAKSIELSNIGKIGIHKLYLYMVKEGIAKLYPNLNILYRLILTLPVTSSACERSFSTLKLIKTRLRSTMCEDRLSNLLLLSAESIRMKSIPKHLRRFTRDFGILPGNSVYEY